MASGIYDNYNLRFNVGTNQLEMNTGAENWVAVPVSAIDVVLPNGQILVGNASNVATAVSMSGAVTISNSGVTSLASHSVLPASITNISTDDFTFPRDVIATRDVLAGRNVVATGDVTATVNVNILGSTSWNWYSDVNGHLNLFDSHGTQYVLFNQTAGSVEFTQFVQCLAQLSTALISGYATTLIIKPATDTTGAIRFRNSLNTVEVMAVDTTNNKLSIGGLPAQTTAVLECISTTQGFLPPVMTTTQKNAITLPATGLVVFDSTLGKLCVFSTTWQTVTSV